MRVVYAFDPSRDAVLLLGGEKIEPRLYERLIRTSERLWEAHLADLKQHEK